MTPHGTLTITVPRLRRGRLDTSLIFQRYQRRIADVERILRHAYLVGASTRDTAELARQIFGGFAESPDHQSAHAVARWRAEMLERATY